MKKKFLSVLLTIATTACLIGCAQSKPLEAVPFSEATPGDSGVEVPLQPIGDIEIIPGPGVDPQPQTPPATDPQPAMQLEYIAEEDIEIDLNTDSLLYTNIGLVDGVSEQCPGENVMISGISVNYALAMLANGASPEALTALEDFLGTDLEAANSYYSAFLNRAETDTQNKLIISNSFWVDDSLPYGIRDSYTNILKSTYQADISYIPMNESGINQVNAWAEQATDGMIKKALSPNDLTSDTSSILVNAILLDGKWKQSFTTDRTREVEFTLADGSTKTVQGMHSSESFYYENEYATGFRKDYEGNEFYMIAVLPKEEGDFTLSGLDLEGFIESGKSTSELNADLSIMLPKTDFEAKYNLTNILKAAGLEQIFDKTSNNFSGIYDNDAADFTSYASSVIQNDRLIIDEEGTKAAAVTSVMMATTTSIRDTQHLMVYLNRPFAILLMDGTTDEPLFVAKIMNP